MPLPQLQPMLPALDHALALDSVAYDDAPFTLQGAGCTIHGAEQAGIREIRMNGRVTVKACRLANVRCRAFRITPLGVERDLEADSVNVREKIVVAPAESAFVIEWIASETVELPLTMQVIANDAVTDFDPDSDAAHIRLAAGRPQRLTISVGVQPRRPDPTTWVRTHSALAEQRAMEWLHVELPEPALQIAFAWAQLRLPHVDSVRATLALIGVGEFDVARSRIAALRAGDEFLSLLQHHTAATGDHAFVHAQWDRALAAAHASSDITAGALRGLAQLAEAVGDGHSASEFKRCARERPEGVLPWRDFAEGNTQVAVDFWRNRARECFQDELGAWLELPGQSAGDVVTDFIYGLVGYSPDAARDRLRLRTQLPEEWPGAAIRNIHIGDAVVELEYTRNEKGCHFCLQQSGGAYPVRLVFEPALPKQPAHIRLDGQVAELDILPFGERIVAPVQIMLDAQRRMEIDW